MGDVFECRVEFSQLISSLATSKKSIPQASSYALSHYSIHLDIFDVLFSEFKDASVSSSLAIKNYYILMESIVLSSSLNGWTGYRDAMESKISSILSIIFHPKRHLDYHIEHVSKLFKLLAERDVFSESVSQEITQTIDNYLSKCTPSKDYDKLTGDKSDLLDRFEEERDLQKRLRDLSCRISTSRLTSRHPVDGILETLEEPYLTEKDLQVLDDDFRKWRQSISQ